MSSDLTKKTLSKLKTVWTYGDDLKDILIKKQKNQTINVYLPARFDFIGGWTDTPPYYFDNPATVINATLDLGEGIKIGHSNMAIQIKIEPANNFQYLHHNKNVNKDELIIIKSILKFLKLKNPKIRININNIIPRGSGLGGSSLLASGIITGIFSYYLGIEKTKKMLGKIVNYTLAVEQIMRSGGGWQDQIGGIWPGIKIIKTSPKAFKEYHIETLPNSNLEKRCLIIDTLVTRHAAMILHSLREKYIQKDKQTIQTLKKIRGNALLGWKLLNQEKYLDFGKVLSESWQAVCQIESGSRIAIVDTIEAAIGEEIAGLKIGGAGGGGFILIILKDPKKRNVVITKIKTKLGQKIKIYKPKFNGPGLIIKQGQKIYTLKRKSKILIK
jgi:galactokinase/mevalonate kinase-like predicted kinase